MFSDNFRRGENGGGKKGSKAVSKMADIGWKAFQDIAKTRSLSLPVIAKVLSEDAEVSASSPYLVEENETAGV